MSTTRGTWILASLVYVCAFFLFPLRTELLNAGQDAVFVPPDTLTERYDAQRLGTILGALGPPDRRLYAWSEVTLDLLFPLAYGALLIGLLRRVAPDRARWAGAWRRLAPLVPVVAAGADLIENAALFCAAYPLASLDQAAPIASLAGWVKWRAVGLALLLVALGSGWSGRLGRVVRLAWLGRVPLFGLAAPVVLASLGTGGQASPTVPNVLVLGSAWHLFAAAFVCGYTAALAGFSLKLVWDLAPLRTGAELAAQPAWLAAYEPGSARAGAAFLPAALPLVFLCAVRSAGEHVTSQGKAGVAPWTAAAAALLGCLLCVALLLLVDAVRRRAGGAFRLPPASVARVQRLIGPGYVADQRFEPGHALAAAGLAVLLVFYGIGWWRLSPQVDAAASAGLPTLAYAFGLLAMMVSLLTGLTFHFDRWRVPLVALLVAVLALTDVFWPKRHEFDARWIDTDLPTVGQALTSRLPGEKPDAVIVTASGGGIQAAAWTARALVGLQEELGRDFTRRVAFVSTASGGSVGAWFWLAALDAEGALPDGAEQAVFEAASDSSLEPIAWGLLYPDLQRALPRFWRVSPTHDRGWAMEQAWIANRRARKLGDGSDERLAQWADDARAGRRPALVFNAVRIDDGLPLHLSTVRGTGKRLLGARFRYGLEPPRAGFLDLRTATAARLSASFPYASPLARPCEPQSTGVCADGVRPWRAADGGYLDNHGTLAALAWLSEVDACVGRVLWVHLDGLPAVDDGGARLDDSPGWWTGLAGPLTGLLRVRERGQALRSDDEIELLRKRWETRLTTVTLRPPPSGPREAPLSWQLGWHDIERIQRGWKQVRGSREFERLRAFAKPQT